MQRTFALRFNLFHLQCQVLITLLINGFLAAACWFFIILCCIDSLNFQMETQGYILDEQIHLPCCFMINFGLCSTSQQLTDYPMEMWLCLPFLHRRHTIQLRMREIKQISHEPATNALIFGCETYLFEKNYGTVYFCHGERTTHVVGQPLTYTGLDNAANSPSGGRIHALRIAASVLTNGCWSVLFSLLVLFDGRLLVQTGISAAQRTWPWRLKLLCPVLRTCQVCCAVLAVSTRGIGLILQLDCLHSKRGYSFWLDFHLGLVCVLHNMQFVCYGRVVAWDSSIPLLPS